MPATSKMARHTWGNCFQCKTVRRDRSIPGHLRGGRRTRLYSKTWRNDMGEVGKNLLLFLSALFPIVDPLGGSPIFLALTREYSQGARKTLSWRIAMNSFFLLVGSYLIGTHVLAFFGISLPVVQVGGGLIVISTGWALLKQRDDDDRKEVKGKMQPRDPLRHAFYPLTLPLTVGPGSISIAITLGANATEHHGVNFLAILAAIAGSVLLAVSTFLCSAFAHARGGI